MTRNTSRPPQVLTAESVTEDHPDKVCDYVADLVTG
jgi:S-adenosylmethionine synthetase